MTSLIKREDKTNLEDKFFEKYREFIKRQGGSHALFLREKLDQALNTAAQENSDKTERTQILQEEQCVATQRLQRVRFEVANLSQRLTALKDQQKHLRKEISVLQSRDALLDTLNQQCETILGLSGPLSATDETTGQKKSFLQFDTNNSVLVQMTQQSKLQMDTIKNNIAKIRGESNPDLKNDPQEVNQKQENLKKFLDNKKENYWVRVQKCKEKRGELEKEKARYQGLLERFEALLEKNEPLVKGKIQANFQRFLNLQCREAMINLMKEILAEYKEEAKPEESTPSKLTGRVRRNLKTIAENSLIRIKNVQALKVRANEFIANHSLGIINDTISYYDDLEKALFFFARHMDTLKNIRIETIESNDFFSWSSKLLDSLCLNSGKVNRPYFSLFSLEKLPASKLSKCLEGQEQEELERKRFLNLIILGKGNFQQRLKLIGHNAQNLQEEISSEKKLTESLEVLLSSFKNQDAQNFVEFLNLHEGRPISYFVDLWKRADFQVMDK